MKKLIASLVLAVLPAISLASGAGVHLDHMKPDLHDKASLQKGAALFTNYCMGCHSLKYARYERIANDLGISNELYEQNLMFGDAKIGELINIAMPASNAKTWFGNPPPDLTLEGRLRGADWLYTYLRAFYVDPSRPYGVNNAVFKDVGMPHVLAGLQGVCAHKPETGAEKKVDSLSGRIVSEGGCEEYLKEGSLSKKEYDETVYDLVNFLVYMGEPSRLQSERLGVYVLLFLAFLFVFVYFLNREYWKDVH
ncbi:MAG: cytochrome c1 [Hahellaceae bacterium]|nr:cytochrome c1 [Hahellaceae bacterium]MCP5169839.1 cytochrome c1 [Hahellaceae bacterium]